MKSRNDMIVAEVRAVTHGRILDIGYAQSPIPELATLGGEVYGVDLVTWPSPYTANYVCDLNTDPLPFSDGTIDVVTMGCTLAHVAKPLKVLAEIHRVLTPGGTLILTSPNPNYYWETVLNVFYHRFKKRVCKSKHVEHFYEFTRYAMRTNLERVGFTLKKEFGSTFHIVTTNIRLDVSKFPGLAFEIIYVAQKTGTPQSFATIDGPDGSVIELPTDLFS